MTWNTILSLTCIISLLFPVAVILINRYFTHKSLAALLISYTLSIFDNLMGEKIIEAAPSFELYFRIVFNYLDVPLMLVALLYFCPTKRKQRLVHIVMAALIVYEIVITCIYGFGKTSITYIIGPALAILLIYTLVLFARQVKFTIKRRINQGRTVMLASILFTYACYTLIYYFHYIQQTKFFADVLFLYFISTSVGAILMAVGLHLMRNRMKELKSVTITRKELALFFGH